LQGKELEVKRKRYSWKFQRMTVEHMKGSDNRGELAQELGVTRRCLYKWCAKLDPVEPGREAPQPNSHEIVIPQASPPFEAPVGGKTDEGGFFKGALQKVEVHARQRTEILFSFRASHFARNGFKR
jgi:hypothetical protein